MLDLLTAFKLSIKNWEWRVENPLGSHDDLLTALSELKELPWSCGLCAYQGVITTSDEIIDEGNCLKCSLHDFSGNLRCSYEYHKWKYHHQHRHKRRSRTWANRLLHRLYELKKGAEIQVEWEREEAMKVA